MTGKTYKEAFIHEKYCLNKKSVLLTLQYPNSRCLQTLRLTTYLVCGINRVRNVSWCLHTQFLPR